MGKGYGRRKGNGKRSEPDYSACREDFTRLIAVFRKFHLNYYRCSNSGEYPESAYRTAEAMFDNAISQFSFSDDCVVNFRYFQIGIQLLERSGRTRGMTRVLPLHDFYYFLRFTRYRENRELLEEIRRLADLASFTIMEIPDGRYLLHPQSDKFRRTALRQRMVTILQARIAVKLQEKSTGRETTSK